jgi:fucose permease
VWTRVGLGIPIAFAVALIWPIARAGLIAAVPGHGGAATMLTTLFAAVPLPLLFGVLAERVGLTSALVVASVPAAIVMVAIAARIDADRHRL